MGLEPVVPPAQSRGRRPGRPDLASSPCGWGRIPEVKAAGPEVKAREAEFGLLTLRLGVVRARGSGGAGAREGSGGVGGFGMDVSDHAVELATTGKFNELHDLCGSQLKMMVTPSQLRDGWDQIVSMYGAYEGIESRGEQKAQGQTFTVHRLKFETGTLNFMSQEDGGQLATLLLQPGAPPPPVDPPAYADPSTFAETEVRVDCHGFPLPALLTVPKKASGVPAVVMVAGSGPNDRDETIGKLKPFRDLAQGLAALGIASIRYDKRTKSAPGMFNVKSGTVNEEVVEDAVSALKVLKSKTGGRLGKKPTVDPSKIFLLGHSLGAMVAPRILDAAPELAGMVLLGGPARRLEDAIIEQSTHLAGPKPPKAVKDQLKAIQVQVDRVKAADLTAETPASDLPLGINASYWLDLRDYDPVEATANAGKPTLVLHGAVDYQATPEEHEQFRRALAGRRDCESKLYPGLSHIFMPGEGTAADYTREANVAEHVVADIARWLASR